MSHSIKLHDAEIKFDLDSKSVCHNVRFLGENSDVKLICDIMEDRDIDLLASSMSSILFDIGLKNTLETQQALLTIKKSLKNIKGEVAVNSDLDLNELICRCSKIDYKRLEKSYKEHAGVKNLVLKETLCSQVCGSCNDLMNKCFTRLDQENDFYMGKEVSFFQNEISEALSEFYMFSPAEISDVSFSIKELNLPSIILNTNISLDEVKSGVAIDSLKNYLVDHLKMDLAIELSNP